VLRPVSVRCVEQERKVGHGPTILSRIGETFRVYVRSGGASGG
jgi:hypothetical protein